MFRKKYDFVVIGAATRDYMFYDRAAKFLFTPADPTRQRSLCFEYGAKVSLDETYVSNGGGAANAAVNLALQGFRTAAVVRLGDDEAGREILKNFAAHEVDTRLVQRDEKAMTGFSFVLTAGQEQEHVIFTNRAANNRLTVSPQTLQQFKAPWIYLSSLSGPSWRKIFETVFSAPANIAWNPGSQQLLAGTAALKKYLGRTAVLALNQDEAIGLVKSSPAGQELPASRFSNVRFLLKTLQAFGPKVVVITRGKAGANAYDGRTYYYQKIVSAQRKVVDTTGVGDCFNSTFVGGLVRFSGDIQRSLGAAIANGASLITKIGAQQGLKKVL
ncbi:carbohydrate kinase family protein [Candidatus Falkowbacteria bacterium]|nr:carbohydrate kinase family protein [Candidatus Falkowbacteria bacterium]